MGDRGIRRLPWAGVLVIGFSCGGGGGSSAPAQTIGFDAANSTVPEGSTASVVVTLTSTTGPLEDDLDVTVSASSGTSTAGSDHDFTVDRTVRFAAGSDDGATETVDVAALTDGLVEGGDETVVLTLSGPTTGALSVATHTLEIQESDFASVSFVQTAFSVDEGDPYDVEIELSLDGGDTLGVDLEIGVSDSGAGSASGGADYDAMVAQTLVFPAGSADGTRLSVSLTSIEDTNAEGDETVELTLTGISGGAQIPGGTTTATIADDDVSGPFLTLQASLSGGPTAALSQGDALFLGSKQLDSGPNGALELTLQNAGDTPFDLEPLNLTGDIGDFSISLNQTPSELPSVGVGLFPFAITEDSDELGASMTLDDARHALFAAEDVVILDGVELPGGAVISLELERVDVPLDPATVVQVDGAPVAHDELIGDLSIWQGRAVGYDDSEVFLSFAGDTSNGWLDLGDELGVLHMTTDTSSGEPVVRWLWDLQLYAAYSGETPGLCAEERLVPGQLVPPSLAPSVDSMTVGLNQPECRLAIETDYQLYQKLGSTAAVTQYVTQLIAAVSDAYERDVQTTLSIAYLGIHSSPADPWVAQDSAGSDAGDVLDEFRAAWKGNIPAGAHLAHFISGASLGGGVAYRGVLCNSNFGFAVSGSINGNINWGTFTGQPSFLNWDFVVVAHEIGHNFGSRHTHDYCPPIDNCYTSCEGFTTCTQGTIMSYCHTCGGMSNVRLEFHPFVADTMRSHVTSSCLDDAQLDPGADVSITISFAPTSAVGALSAQLELVHTASNQPTPFRIDLTGTSTN